MRNVLSSLPTHIALILPLSKSMSNQMEEAIMRNFLWSGGAVRQKRNQINWETVTLPYKEGGLGIRRVSNQNEASFIKMRWIAMTSNSLWSNWMAGRYFPDSSIWHSSTSKTGSSIWRKIRKLAHHIQSGSK